MGQGHGSGSPAGALRGGPRASAPSPVSRRALAVAAGMATGHFCAAVITGLQMATEDHRRAVPRWPASRGVVGRREYGAPVRLRVFPEDRRQRATSGPSSSASWPTAFRPRCSPASRTSPADARSWTTTPWCSRPCATASARPWTSRGWNASSGRSRAARRESSPVT
jgi:hypothetical protein